MVVDVDEQLAVGRRSAPDRAQAFEAGAVGGDHAVESLPALGLLETAVRVEETRILRECVFVPADDLLAFVLRAPG